MAEVIPEVINASVFCWRSVLSFLSFVCTTWQLGVKQFAITSFRNEMISNTSNQDATPTSVRNHNSSWLSFLYLSCMAIVLVLRSGILSRIRFLHMLLFFNDEFIGYFSLVQTKITETNISVFTFYWYFIT